MITDGGGALVVVSSDVARSLERHCVKIMGQGEAINHPELVGFLGDVVRSTRLAGAGVRGLISITS